MKHLSRSTLWICVVIMVVSTSHVRAAELGDPAAALNIQSWVKGKPVTLSKGRSNTIYVVEFWATWCEPCRASIPHLTELQQKYKNKNVVFIGVSDEPVETVEPYVLKMGKKMEYTVAVDPTRKTHKGYMTAYNQGGIPTAFVVDRDVRIAWVGHPMGDLDKVLSQVVDGTYNIENAKRVQAARGKIPEYFELLVSGKTSDARRLGLRIALDGREDAQLLNRFAWAILTEPDLPHRDLDLAMKVARVAYESSGGKNASITDTYTRAHYDLGNFEEAVLYQQEAVDAAGAPNMRRELMQTLTKYKTSVNSH